MNRRGIALAVVLLLVIIGLGIALAIRHFSQQSYARAARGAYATLSEVLADSLAEEAFHQIQKEMNDPPADREAYFGTEDKAKHAESIYAAFRTDWSGPNNHRFRVRIKPRILQAQLADPQFAGYLKDRYELNPAAPDFSFVAYADAEFTNPYPRIDEFKLLGPPDPLDPAAVRRPVIGDGGSRFPGHIGGHGWERIGILTITAEVRPKARHEALDNFRAVRVKRVFRQTLVTPPEPYFNMAFYVNRPEHVTDFHFAGGLFDSDMPPPVKVGAKTQLQNDLLEPLNRMVETINKDAKAFVDAAKEAKGDCKLDPPKWMQDVMGDLAGGLVRPVGTKVDLAGDEGRPFLHDDVVWAGVPELDKVGDLSLFNYQKNIVDKLGPVKALIDAVQRLAELNNKVLAVIGPIHAAIPRGGPLEAVKCVTCCTPNPIDCLPCKDCGKEFVDNVNALHDKLLDPIIRSLVGAGQVLALTQKNLVEMSAMGQQAFEHFIESRGVTGHTKAFEGIPNGHPDLLAEDMPNFEMGSEKRSGSASGTAGVMGAATGVFDGLLNEVSRAVVGEVKNAVLAGFQKLVAAAAAGMVAGSAVKPLVEAALGKIGGNIGPLAGGAGVGSVSGGGLGIEALRRIVVDQLVAQLDFLQDHTAMSGTGINLTELATRMFRAALAGESLDAAVKDALAKFRQQVESKASSYSGPDAVDALGGTLKGYVLRHRFRNLIEFDDKGTKWLQRFRWKFQEEFKPAVWKAKATWVISKPEEWQDLIDRYVKGVWSRPGRNPAGEPDPHWDADAFAHSRGFGLSGIVYYSGTEELPVRFPQGAPFFGKLIIYAPSATIRVEGCRMRNIKRDMLTVISGRNIELPAERVDLNVYAVGPDSKIGFKASGEIFGQVVLNRYTVTDQSGPYSFKGTLRYNPGLKTESGRTDPAGNPLNEIRKFKPSHLWVTLSPYALSREVLLTPPSR